MFSPPPKQSRPVLRGGSTAIERGTAYRRLRPGIDPRGSSADHHYDEHNYLRLIELARDYERNDAVGAAVVSRVVHNVVQHGLAVTPNTGNPDLDALIVSEWGDGPRDMSGRFDFRTAQELALRASIRDGDSFAVLHPGGAYELIEGHEVCSRGAGTPTVLGVEVAPSGAARAYWINGARVEAARVVHLVDRRRATQTRGVSAFEPIIDELGMFQDIQIAKLIQQRIASSFAILRNRQLGAPPEQVAPIFGPQSTANGVTETAYQAGIEFVGQPGETLAFASANIPNAEYFQHAELTLRLVAAAIGVPLIALLYDASDTNFSGWRGAMDAARIGWSRQQDILGDCFVSPLYRHWLAHKLESPNTEYARLAATTATPLAHRVNAPRWPYIQPVQDVQAETSRITGLLAAPSRVHAERGQVWSDEVSQVVADNAAAWRAAIAESHRIMEDTGVDIPANLLLVIDTSKTIQANGASPQVTA